MKEGEEMRRKRNSKEMQERSCLARRLRQRGHGCDRSLISLPQKEMMTEIGCLTTRRTATAKHYKYREEMSKVMSCVQHACDKWAERHFCQCFSDPSRVEAIVLAEIDGHLAEGIHGMTRIRRRRGVRSGGGGGGGSGARRGNRTRGRSARCRRQCSCGCGGCNGRTCLHASGDPSFALAVTTRFSGRTVQ